MEKVTKISIISKLTGTAHVVTLIDGKQRGWKSAPLDGYLMKSGYRIMPYEFNKYWKYLTFNDALKDFYCRRNLMADLLYTKNPFLQLCK